MQQGLEAEGRLVRLPEQRAGLLFNQPKQIVYLEALFGDNPLRILGVPATVAYFRTGSGNIYRMDQAGLTDSRSSAEEKKLVHFPSYTSQEYFDSEVSSLPSYNLVVGSNFHIFTAKRIRVLTRLTEIVVTSGAQYALEQLEKIEDPTVLTITQDFQTRLQSAGIQLPPSLDI